MIISKGKPSTAISWFLKHDEDHELLAVFVGATPVDYELSKQFINRYNQFDTAMGGKVAFLLFSSPTDNIIGFPYQGECEVIPGELTVTSNSAAPYFPIRETSLIGPSFLQQEANEIIARKMQNVAMEFCERYSNLSYENLPALFVFTKETEEGLVIECSENWDIDELCSILYELARCVQVNSTKECHQLDMPRVTNFLKSVDRDASALRETRDYITDSIGRIFWDIDHTHEDKVKFSQFLEKSTFSGNEVEQLFEDVSFFNSDSFIIHPKRNLLIKNCKSYVRLVQKVRQNILKEKEYIDGKLQDLPFQDFLMERERRRKEINTKVESYIKSHTSKSKNVAYLPRLSANDIIDQFNRYSSLGKDFAGLFKLLFS
ncbi:hypothetical protein AB6D04_10305 [Vibrio splendidus]|uniref:hypothetical protein n=1 Tax=Vibrio splendidus TaxID=29497 RepID=UPI000C84E560|nr:hypothetical protein [Vibrio splendidus]PMN75380.1 hypothetical protein BCT24_07045 [Vibrio splendidus]